MNHEKTYWWHYALPPTILSFLTTVFYYPSLRYAFLFDDLPGIVKNYEIRLFAPRKMFFSNSRWISKLLNQFTYYFWKLSPFAYRIIDLVIHIIAGVLVFVLVLLICKNVKKNSFLKQNYLVLATIVSGLFLLHPVQTQTVSYITQIRLEGLVAIFSFATIITLALATLAKHLWLKTTLYTFCAILVLFAAGTKEIIIVLPILLLLVDWFFLAEGDIKVFFKRLPIHFVLAIILYYTWIKMGTHIKPAQILSFKSNIANNRGNILTSSKKELITPIKYLIGQFRVVLHYFTMFFWPLNLSFDYGWKIPPSFWSAASIFPFLTLISIAITGLILFLKNLTNIFSFCIAWFFIVVLPRSTIVPSTEFVCDYKTYLASFGVLFLIGYFMTYIFLFIKKNFSQNRKTLQFVLPTLLFVTLGFASQQRNSVWISRTAFWKDVLDKTEPHASARAYNNYAVGLVEKGKREQAVEFYEKSIEADKTYAEPVINLALHYQLKKEYKKALELYNHAIALKEGHPELFNNLGLLYLKIKSYDKAELAFKKALKIRHYYGKAFFNLGQTYQVQNRLEDALVFYEKAVKSNFQTINYYYKHGLVSYLLKKYDKATKSLEAVEKLQKNYKNTRSMLANSYYHSGQISKSVPFFEYLYKSDPKSASKCYNYAQSLIRTEKYSLALPLFEKCKDIKSLPFTKAHIEKCLKHIGTA